MRDEYMFETAEDCCEKYFFIQGEDCLVKDICLDTVITLKPPGSVSNNPTYSPVIGHAEISCESKLWHPLTDYTSCTNE